MSAFEQAGRTLSAEELAKLPRHMQPQGADGSRTGRRRDTVLRVEWDGRVLLEKTYRPGGLHRDGPTFVYEELPIPLGRHRLVATLAAAGHPPHRRLDQEVDVRPSQALLLEF